MKALGAVAHGLSFQSWIAIVELRIWKVEFI